ncbi:MAG: GIY-YIG nuclease family protein [Patescibacteria group bacterium]
MYYVYILRLGNGKPYVGSTPDLKRRLHEHQQGMSEATKRFLPCSLVCYICLPNLLLARQFEEYLKSGSGRAFRKRHFGI